MPSQASANGKILQAAGSVPPTNEDNEGPDPSLIATVASKIDVQEQQGVEDGSIDVTTRKLPATQVDGSVACFTVGRPPLYAGSGEDIHKEVVVETTRAGITGSTGCTSGIAVYQPATTLPLPRRCGVRAVVGKVLQPKQPSKEGNLTRPAKITSATSESIAKTIDNAGEFSSSVY